MERSMNHKDDGDFWEIAKEVEELVATGATVFQKFTCEACLARETMPDPNVLYKAGRCDECGHITNLELRGCGFMLVASTDPVAHAAFVEVLRESIESAQPRNRN
jgi:hypothetical protein